jgi:hypothetical protein
MTEVLCHGEASYFGPDRVAAILEESAYRPVGVCSKATLERQMAVSTKKRAAAMADEPLAAKMLLNETMGARYV